MDRRRVRIIKKNDECSTEYRIGDMFLADSTRYGGINATSKLGVPLSLDRKGYEFVGGEDAGYAIDAYFYGPGVMDCFCEIVSAGLKTLAIGHPCDTKEGRDSYLADVEKLCRKYGVKLHPKDGIKRLIRRTGTESQ